VDSAGSDAGAGGGEGSEMLSGGLAVAVPTVGGCRERSRRSSMPRRLVSTSRCTVRCRSSSRGVRERAREVRGVGERSRELEREGDG